MIGALGLALGTIVLASVVIKLACDSFEPAADHLGRNMPSGVKGATINAVGSSLPELLTSIMLLFIYHDRDGFAAGVATCAGSAVFNVVVIPALCVLAVTRKGVLRPDGRRERVTHIHFERSALVRDGLFFLGAELVLIALLGRTTLGWKAGALLVSTYALYLGFLGWQMRGSTPREHPHAHGGFDASRGRAWALLTFDFNVVFFGGRHFSDRRALVVVLASVAVLGGACHSLAWAVMSVADALNIAPYFAALVLAAAATSIPDAILSIKDSLKGDYDDAIANAFGSNTFDIGICIGLPLLVYALVFEPVTLASDPESVAGIQSLRIALLMITALVLGLLWWGKRIGRGRASLLLLTYASFTTWVIGSALHWWG